MSSKNQDDKNQEKPESSDNASKGFRPNSRDEDKRPQASAETVTSKTARPGFDGRERETRKAEIEVVYLDDDEHEDNSDEKSEPGVVGRKREPRKAEIEVIYLDDDEHEDNSDKKSEPGVVGREREPRKAEIEVICLDDDEHEVDSGEQSEPGVDKKGVPKVSGNDAGGEKITPANVALGVIELLDNIIEKTGDFDVCLVQRFIEKSNDGTKEEVIKQAGLFLDSKIEELSLLNERHNADLLEKYVDLRSRLTNKLALALNVCRLAIYVHLPFDFANAEKRIFTNCPINPMNPCIFSLPPAQTPSETIYVPPVLEKLSPGPIDSMGVPLASSTPLYEPMIQDDLPPAAAQSRPEPNPPVDPPFCPGRGMFVMTDVFNNDLKNFRQMILDHATEVFDERLEESVTAHCKTIKEHMGKMTEQEMVKTVRDFMRKRAEQLIALESNEKRIVMLAKLYEHLVERNLAMRKYVNVCYVAGFYGRPEFDTIEKNVMRPDH